MKIIVNCAGLHRGGVIQASVSFIDACRKKDEHTFYVFILNSQRKAYNINNYPDNFHFYFVDKSPTKSLKTLLKLRKLENQIKPDVVFSPYGPSFWKPKAPHLFGFALPFLVYPDSYFFKLYKPSLRFKVEKAIKIFLAKHTGDFVYVENEDIKNRLVSMYGFKENRVHYVKGTYNQIYDKPLIKRNPFLPARKEGEFRFVTIAPFFKHKNLIIINEIVDLLKSKNICNVRFVLTIDQISYENNFYKHRDYVTNVGPIKIEECPLLYSECDATFMPTFLESYTAIYPDSIKMGKPIITSNLGFATSVCGDAALYFDPASPVDAIDRITDLINSKDLYKQLVIKGKDRLNNFYTASERAERYFDLMELMIRNRNKIRKKNIQNHTV